MIYTQRPLRVFLCHASSDKPVVIKLYKRLVNDGVDAWIDKEKLIPGQDWKYEIPKAVKNSDVVIVCLSSLSINKEGFVQKEIKIALDIADEKPEGSIFIIPARLENCKVPERISQFHWVDLFSKNGYELLLRALEVRANTVGAMIKFSSENHLEDYSLEDESYDESILSKEYYTELQIIKSRKYDISKKINELNEALQNESNTFGKFVKKYTIQAFLSLVFIGIPIYLIITFALDIHNSVVYWCGAGIVPVIVFFVGDKIYGKGLKQSNDSITRIEARITKLQEELEPIDRYIESFNETEQKFYKLKSDAKDLRW